MHTFDFRVSNNDCKCLTYVVRDRENKITYEFTANYSLDDDILTTITVKVENGSQKILSFDHARVKVSSKRFGYQFNDKFVPFSPVRIKPGGNRELTLVGRAEVEERDEWHRIAGEKMTVAIRGIRLGDDEIQVEEVQFVPANPKLGSD